MNLRSYIPLAVLGIGIFLAVVGILDYAIGDEPDYATLSPAPDSIVWREGDDRTLWLLSNRRAADIRISSRHLGVAALTRPAGESDHPVTLGEGMGCLHTVVSGLSVTSVADTSAALMVQLDKETGVSANLYWRLYEDGEDPGGETAESAQVSAESHRVALAGLTEGTTYRVDASANEIFPTGVTRSISFTAGDADSGTSDARGQEIAPSEGTGATLRACAEADDVVLTLHGTDGVELNRYVVDVLAAGPAPPSFGQSDYARWVCTDFEDDRANYFDGGETVQGGAISATGATGYAVSPSDSEPLDYALFAVDSAGTLTVNDIGADDTSGLDGSRLYALEVVASNATGSVHAGVAIQVVLGQNAGGDGSGCR